MSIPCIRGHHFDSSLLHSDSVIIDLGGHKGEFSSEVHEKFDCTAFIIEAMPDLYASIIQKPKLHTFHYAISDSIGSIQFHVSENPESNSIFSQSTTNAGTILVPSITLEAFMNQQGIESVDLLKMDIEGAEFQVVGDCIDSLKKVDHFFLEYHGKVDQTKQLYTMLQQVESIGFHVYIKMAADQLTSPFYQKQTGTPYDVQLNIFCYKQIH